MAKVRNDYHCRNPVDCWAGTGVRPSMSLDPGNTIGKAAGLEKNTIGQSVASAAQEVRNETRI
jgi:hypothetical protein